MYGQLGLFPYNRGRKGAKITSQERQGSGYGSIANQKKRLLHHLFLLKYYYKAPLCALTLPFRRQSFQSAPCCCNLSSSLGAQ